MTNFKKISLFIFLFFFLTSFLNGQTTKWRLLWDKNKEPDMKEYEVYRSIGSQNASQLHPYNDYAIISHHDSDYFLDDSTMELVDDYQLTKGLPIYYRLKAVDSTNLKSDFSEEVSAAIPCIGEPYKENIPDLNIFVGQQFDSIRLDDYITDPDLTAGEKITWNIRFLTVNSIGVDTTILDNNVLFLSPNPMNQIGSVTLEFTANDPDSFFDVDTAMFSVKPWELIANDDAFDVYLDESEVNLDVLDNDNIPPGSVVRIDTIFCVSSCNANKSADSLLIIYNAPSNGESDWFDYIVRDINSDTITARATVNISLFNFEAHDTTISLTSNTPVTLNVTQNDEYIRSDISILLDILTPPIYGTVTKNTDISFRYTPPNNITTDLIDSFQYSLYSGRINRSDTATVSIMLSSEANNSPSAENFNVMIMMNSQNVQLNVPNHVQDEDGDEIIIIHAESQINATLNLILNNTDIEYTPPVNYVGLDTLSYTISDNISEPVNAEIYIAIEQPDDKITAYPIPFRPRQGGARDITFSNLPEGGKLIIYDLLGYPVYETNITSSEHHWGILNQHGKWVRSGVYLYVVKNEKGKIIKSNKIIIIL